MKRLWDILNWNTFSERERKGEVLGSVRYAPQLPISVPSSAERCQLGGKEGVAEIRQGAGRSQRPAGAGSGADISISQSPCLAGRIKGKGKNRVDRLY